MDRNATPLSLDDATVLLAADADADAAAVLASDNPAIIGAVRLWSMADAGYVTQRRADEAGEGGRGYGSRAVVMQGPGSEQIA